MVLFARHTCESGCNPVSKVRSRHTEANWFPSRVDIAVIDEFPDAYHLK
jgi:hypothetical protein